MTMLGRDVMVRILDVAEKTLPPRFDLMREMLAANNSEQLAFLAHATRSSATAAGFDALKQDAELMERAAKAQDFTMVAQLIALCEKDFMAGLAAARRLIARINSQEMVAPNR